MRWIQVLAGSCHCGWCAPCPAGRSYTDPSYHPFTASSRQGKHHLKIAKQASSQTIISDTYILDDSARIEEIARMLSGDEITNEARAAKPAGSGKMSRSAGECAR